MIPGQIPKSVLDQTDPPIYTIGDAAKALDVSIGMLRVYEAQGLIVPARTDSNQRRYSRSDLARLACIRHAIREDHLTIPAIKRMMALVPCWEIIQCSETDRENCGAYRGLEGPCWTYKHKNNVCATLDCRSCRVYQMSGDCSKIKELIVFATNHSNGKEQQS